MSDVVDGLCFLGYRKVKSNGMLLVGQCLRIFLLVSIESCLLGDDVLHAK